MKTNHTTSLVAAILLVAAATNPSANAAGLLEIKTGEGADERIEGESTAPDHGGWIDVLSVGLAAEEGINTSATRRGVPQVKPVIVTKRIDKSSPLLAKSAITGQTFPQVTIKLPLDGAHPGFIVTLYDVVVDSYNTSLFISTASDEKPTEEVTFGYTKIEWTYSQGADGLPVARSSFDRLFGTNDPERDDDGDNLANALDDDDDNDGIDDGYELRNGLHPLVADAEFDDDDDGKTNREEWLAGTRSNIAGSVFGIHSIAFDREGQVTIKVPTIGGRRYQLIGSFDLGGDNWMPLDQFETAAGSEPGMMELLLPPAAAAQADRLFFKAEVSLPGEER
ncbi:MAG: type VI secretion system Hcp family effector [Pseudoalteromonas tetraodonis]|jgi:type VI secretion system Hcp family effector